MTLMITIDSDDGNYAGMMFQSRVIVVFRSSDSNGNSTVNFSRGKFHHSSTVGGVRKFEEILEVWLTEFHLLVENYPSHSDNTPS